MEIKQLKDKAEIAEWQEFLKDKEISVWQLSEFGDFQRQVASRGGAWIFGVFEEGRLVNGIQVVQMRLGRGYFWLYGGRGPVNERGLDSLIQTVKSFGAVMGAIFVRIDPAFCCDLTVGRKAGEGFAPQTTLVLDLKQSEEDLLKGMKQKGRYNIKLAGKKGVEVFKANADELGKYLAEYERLLKETTKRDGFRGHNIGYYKLMLEGLGKKAGLYVAKHDGEVLAAAIWTGGGSVATYYYGVSGNRKRNLMAPYLLQWKMICDSKAAGFEIYDFLGISPEGATGHSWAGVTSFKKKFGGEVREYMEPREVVLRPVLYWAWKVRRWVKKRF